MRGIFGSIPGSGPATPATGTCGSAGGFVLHPVPAINASKSTALNGALFHACRFTIGLL
jgi:hypothetical protein